MYRLLFLLSIWGASLAAQTLYPSEHSTHSGQAELNSFKIYCEGSCFFTMYLEVKKLDFESKSESGAMYRVWNEDRSEYIIFGIDANKETGKPQVSLTSSSDNEKHILGTSKIGDFEGFRFEWKGNKYTLKNLRSVPKEGYSQILESGISFEGKLHFKPFSVEYLFLGVDVKQYLDASSQNINPAWKEHSSNGS